MYKARKGEVVEKLPSPFRTKVVGVSFANDYPDSLIRILRLMEELPTQVVENNGIEASLIREPDNPHDPNAIAVMCCGSIIGHIPRELAKRLSPELDNKVPWICSVENILVNPDHPDRPGANLFVKRIGGN